MNLRFRYAGQAELLLRSLGLILIAVGLCLLLFSKIFMPKFDILETADLSQGLVDIGALDLLALIENDGALDLERIKALVANSLDVSVSKLKEFERRAKPFVMMGKIGWTAVGLGSLALLLYFFVRPPRSVSGLPAVDFDNMNKGEVIKALVNSLAERAQNMRSQAKFFMLMLSAVCVGGFALFYYAGEIAARESSYELGEFLDDALEEVRVAAESLDHSMDDISYNLSSGDIEPATAEALVKVSLERISQNIAALKEVPLQVGVQVADSDNRLVSAVATRTGTVLILIFLAKVLISAYKYSTRMAGFYASRADALLLVAENYPADLGALVKSLAPDLLDFEKTTDEVLGKLLGMMEKPS